MQRSLEVLGIVSKWTLGAGGGLSGFSRPACLWLSECCTPLHQQQQRQQQRQHNTHAAQHQGPHSSVLPKEAQKFAAMADEWWDPSGPFAPLHRLNTARCKFIRDAVCAMHGLDPGVREPFQGLRVLDVGCGGGILSESMARLGAITHGIDITSQNVEVARLHALQDPLVAARVRYDCTPLESLLLPAETGSEAQATTTANSSAPTAEASPQAHTSGSSISTEFEQPEQQPQHYHHHQQQQQQLLYDVVLASEVVEHVRRPDKFVHSLAQAVAPGGTLVVSTLSRTPAAFAVAILGAEYITRIVPKGTHEWHRFITPQELYMMADAAGLSIAHAAGMGLQGGSFVLTGDLSTNYIAAFHKPAQLPASH